MSSQGALLDLVREEGWSSAMTSRVRHRICIVHPHLPRVHPSQNQKQTLGGVTKLLAGRRKTPSLKQLTMYTETQSNHRLKDLSKAYQEKSIDSY